MASQQSIYGDSVATAEGRADPRYSVSLRAVVVSDAVRNETIQIRNIARLGFLADARNPRETGETIVMDIERIGTREAYVIWSTSGQFGGRFTQPIETDIYR
jgi:CRISPR/Cas system-associated protein Cas5 (RAMP superfamily)